MHAFCLLQTKYECGHIGGGSRVFANVATQTERVSAQLRLTYHEPRYYYLVAIWSCCTFTDAVLALM